MTKVILFVIAGIVALNVALLAGAALVAVLDRRRRKRDIRYLEHIWHLSPRRPVAVGHARSEAPHRPVGRIVPAGYPRIGAALRPTRSSGGRRLVGVTLVAALAFAGTASASPHARDVVASVFTSVTTGLGLHDEADDRALGTDPLVGARPSKGVPRDVRSATGVTGSRSGGTWSPSWSPSDPPAEASGSTITDPGVPPLASASVTAVPASSSAVSLEWNDIAGESGYRVERSADGTSGWTTVAAPAQNTTTATDTGLAAETTYWYRVYATTPAGDASVSDVVSATTLLDPPAPPIVLAVPASSTQVDLSWTDVDGEAGYRIEVSLDGTTWTQAGTQGAGVTAFSDVGLAPGTTYWYRVVAFNAAGESAPSDPQMATTLADPDPPSDPPSGAPEA